MAKIKVYKSRISISKTSPLDYSKVLGRPRMYKRSTVKFSETPSTIKIFVVAGDATAMRAALNSIMRDIQVIEAAARVDYRKSK